MASPARAPKFRCPAIALQKDGKSAICFLPHALPGQMPAQACPEQKLSHRLGFVSMRWQYGQACYGPAERLHLTICISQIAQRPKLQPELKQTRQWPVLLQTGGFKPVNRRGPGDRSDLNGH
jgi:hypothetical protein